MKIGFDNDKYLKMQSEHIRERINQFGNKLYLEFGGKLFDDYHASRVLPGFEPDSKLRMLMQLSDQAEIVIVISAADIDKNKVRGDLYKRGVKAGYAKFETFPIWNIPLKHPVNLAYEAATADLNDVNMIDPFHLEAYGETTINYNRDVEVFPVLQAMFEKIMGECPYKSPTDMGVNMAGNCIVDDEVCKEAARQEIIRRYYKSMEALVRGTGREEEVYKIELLLKQAP